MSTYPSSYYPETSWADDLELGATEAATAARLLGDPRAGAWLTQATHWAQVYAAGGDHDTLNLYDTSALADAELAAELPRPSSRDGAARQRVLADLAAQLDGAMARAAHDPFGSAAVVTDYDAVSHELGLVATRRALPPGHRLAPVRRLRGPPAGAGSSAPTPGARRS